LYLDGDDKPYIACRGENGKRLELVVPSGTAWVKHLVDDATVQIGFPSLDVGEDGAVHISYAYYVSTFGRDLYYAYGEPVPGPCTSQLSIATFDDQDGDGVKAAGEPYISWPYTLTVDGVDQVVGSPDEGWYTTTLTETATWTVTAHTDVNWMPTTPTSLNGVASCVDQQALFGVRWKEHAFLPLAMK
jgi:hypothetical protein